MAKREDLLRAAGETDQWKNLYDFARWEIKTGGPDPHMKMVVWTTVDERVKWEEAAWRGLCYLGAYNFPTGAVLWENWPWGKAESDGVPLDWVKDNWKGISLRRERKCVNSPEKLTRYLNSAVTWLRDRFMEREFNSGWMFEPSLSSRERYDQGWDNLSGIYTMGRYVKIKYLEYSRLCLGVDCTPYDIRPKDGWSPRESMVLLFPDKEQALLGDDTQKNLRLVDQCTREAVRRLERDYGLKLDCFSLQVLLCEYRQCYVGRRQYPGRSHDSERKHEEKIAPHWGRHENTYRVRKSMFPKEVLGEFGGWSGVREDLGDCLAVHGYMWTDFRYDYLKSKADLSRPIRRG